MSTVYYPAGSSNTYSGSYPPVADDAPVVSDTFTRADNTNTVAGPETGPNAWTQPSGTWGIVSNQLYKSAVNGNEGFCIIDSGVSDGNVSVAIKHTGTASWGMAFRWSNSSNYWIANFWSGDGGLRLYKNVAGAGLAAVGAASALAGYNSGDVMRINLNGDAIKVFWNDVEKLTASDSFNSTATSHGVRGTADTTDANHRWDDFLVEAL